MVVAVGHRMKGVMILASHVVLQVLGGYLACEEIE
jgi:hypothetical protein